MSCITFFFVILPLIFSGKGRQKLNTKINKNILRNRLKNNGVIKIVVLQVIFLTCSFSIVVAQTNINDTANTANFANIGDSIQKQNSDSISSVNLDDSTKINNDTINIIEDSTAIIQDTTIADTVPKGFNLSPSAVTSIVDYYAEDSVTFELNNSTVFLHNKTDLNYEDINLVSDYVEVNFSKSELFARGEEDTAGNLQGKPVFKQGTYEVKSHEILYNFETKKGLIRNVITQEGESYLHGELLKKNADNTSYIYKGKYTTCDLEHPHYEIGFKKAKVIPDDKILTGPAWVRIADVPLVPFPFGYFPNSNKRKNGLIFPAYGQRIDLGPFLEGLGYYFAIKEVIDFSVKVNLYMRGAFGATVSSNYIKRYKHNGNFDLTYSFTPTGEKTTPQYQKASDYKVYWKHTQDRKSHPVNNFSANVDFKTSTYSQNNMETNVNNYTQSKAMSMVNFSTSFKGKYSLGINAELSQDFANKNLDMKLPQINFGVSQFHPFRRKKVSGKLKWYENISMQYNMDFQNIVNTYDSVLVNDFKHAFDNFKMGMTHNIPIKSIIKILKHINWENSVTLRETWQIKGVKQSWRAYDSINRTNVHRDTVYRFFPAHDLTLSSGFSTTLYGMYVPFKPKKIQALRHSLTPSVSFSYRPAINKKTLYNSYSYYDEQNERRDVRYSYLDGSLYGAPAYKSSGKINFSLNNKFEMKLKNSKKDEEETFKKITLIENLSISTAYDLLADSMNWDMLNVSARTTIFKQINVSLSINFDPYIIAENGNRINKTEWKVNKRLFRMSNLNGDVSFSYTIDKNLFQRKDEKDKKEKKESTSRMGAWSVSISYIYNYGMSDNYEFYQRYRTCDTIIKRYIRRSNNSISISGDFELTPKWHFRFQSGYNVTEKVIVPTEIGIERDLHCWRITFDWVPLGAYRSFKFGIYAKASILSDAKYERKRELY